MLKLCKNLEQKNISSEHYLRKRFRVENFLFF